MDFKREGGYNVFLCTTQFKMGSKQAEKKDFEIRNLRGAVWLRAEVGLEAGAKKSDTTEGWKDATDMEVVNTISNR